MVSSSWLGCSIGVAEAAPGLGRLGWGSLYLLLFARSRQRVAFLVVIDEDALLNGATMVTATMRQRSSTALLRARADLATADSEPSDAADPKG